MKWIEENSKFVQKDQQEGVSVQKHLLLELVHCHNKISNRFQIGKTLNPKIIVSYPHYSFCMKLYI